MTGLLGLGPPDARTSRVLDTCTINGYPQYRDPRAEHRQPCLRQQPINTRLRLPIMWLHKGEHERIWAVVAARDAGLSINGSRIMAHEIPT